MVLVFWSNMYFGFMDFFCVLKWGRASKFDRRKTREYREKFAQPLYENTLQAKKSLWSEVFAIFVIFSYFLEKKQRKK